MKSPRSSLSVSAWLRSSTCGPSSPTNSGKSSRPWSTTRYVGLSLDCSCPTAASAFLRTRVPPVLFSGSVSISAIWWRLGLSASRESILVCLTNLATRYPPMPPKLNRRRAMTVLSKIDAILAWEARHENQRDTRFVELGKYLCEVRAGQYWRLENLKSFDEFLERRFPESRRKAYYLMSIHEQLPPQVRKELKQVGWTKGVELAKLARHQGQHFESATWLHKARPDVDTRTASTPGKEGAETGGLDEGGGVGQAGPPPGSALRKCNLVAQSQTDAQGGVPAGSGEGADRQGQRAFGADLFQSL